MADMSNSQKAVHAGLWYTVSNIFLRAITVITAPIFTRLLSSYDYGIVSIFTSWVNMLSLFTGLGLAYSIGRAKIDFSYNFEDYLASIQALSSLTGFVFLTTVILKINFFSNVVKLDNNIMLIMAIYLFFLPSIEYVQSKLRFSFEYKANIAMALYIAISTVILSIFLILYSPFNRYTSRIYGIVLPNLLLAILCWLYTFKNGMANIKYWKYALKVSLPMIPHSLAMVVLVQIDRIMIGNIIGQSEAGIYSFGYTYAIVGQLIINGIGFAWQPWVYENLVVDNIKDIRRNVSLLNVLVMFFTIVFIAVAPEAIMLLGSSAFWEAKWMVAPVAIGTFYQYMYNNFSQIELYTKKTVWIAVGSVMAASLNYILNIIFIPMYGYNAAAVTTMVGYLALMIFHWIFAIVTYHKCIYDGKTVLLHCAFTTILGFMFMALYNQTAVRYLLLIMILVVIVTHHKNNLKILFVKRLFQ